MREITDPELLKQLESKPGEEVTDPTLIRQLEQEKVTPAKPAPPVQTGEQPIKQGGLLSEEQREKEFGVIRKAPPKWIEPVKTGLETAGLVGGAVLGAPLGPAASVAGAGLGYAGMRGATDIGLELLGYKKPVPLPERTKKAVSDIAGGATIEAGGQVAGRVISPIVTSAEQLVRAPFGKAMTSPESQELARIYKEFNIPASPSDLIPGSKTLAIAEGVLGYRPLSGDVMLRNALKKVEALNVAREQLINRKASADTVEAVGNRVRKEAEALLEKYTNAKGQKLANMVDEFTSKLGISGKYDVGKRFTETMSGARQVRHDAAEGLYNNVKQMLPAKGDDIVPLSVETTDLAKKLMKEELSKPAPLQDRKILGILKSFGGGEIKLPEGVTPWEVSRDPELRKMIESRVKPELTWDGMKNTRSDLLERVREIYRTSGEATKKSKIFGDLAEAIDTDMSAFAQQQGGDIWKTYSNARKAWKEMHEVFDKDILKIMRSNPEDILNRVVNKGEVTLLRQVRQAGGEEALTPLKQGFFKQALDSSTSNGILNPAKLGNSLKRIGTETLSALATPEEMSMLNNIVKSGQFFSEKQAGMKTIEFLEALSKTDAPRTVDAIIKPNNTYTVRMAKKLLSPERLQEIQSSALEKMFKVSGSGNYLPVSSAKAWAQYNAPMKELLPKQTYSAVTDFLKAGQNMNRVEALAKNASQTGQVLLGSEIGGAVLRRPLSVGKLLLVPWALAKIYVNPTAQAFLTRALKFDPISPEAISLFIRATTVAGINMAKTPTEVGRSTLPPTYDHSKYESDVTTGEIPLIPRESGGVVTPVIPQKKQRRPLSEFRVR
jgi:hypothetical protein